MVQKYQNEIAPIFTYGISTKTNENDLKIPILQALTLGHIIKMTLYLILSIIDITQMCIWSIHSSFIVFLIHIIM